MPTQRKGDHLERRIPLSQEEGTFDQDLHRTLNLTVRQVNELEEELESVKQQSRSGPPGRSQTGAPPPPGPGGPPGGPPGDLPGDRDGSADSRFDELESRLADLENRFEEMGEGVTERLDTFADRIERIELQSRDEVFLEPIELRAEKSEIFGSDAAGRHTIEFDPYEVSFRPKAKDTKPFSVSAEKTFFGETARFVGAGESRYADVWASNNGNLQIAPKRPDPAVQGPAPADVEIEADEILPKEPYETSLGSDQRKYLSLHVAELWVEQLVAQKKIATIGGNIFVGPTTELTDGLSGDPADAGDHPSNDFYNYVRVKHNQMAPGDVVMMENFTRVEFMRVESGPVQFEAKHKKQGGDDNPFDFYRKHNYRYRVERDLDGSGANSWGKGTAVVNTGRKRSGFIDLYSERSRRAANESGPSMAISIREEDKSSYGRGPWGPGVKYKSGDIVYWDSEEWSVTKKYEEGDVVLSPRRPGAPGWSLEDRKFYVADFSNEPRPQDTPLSGSGVWSLYAAPNRWAIKTDYEAENIVYVEGEDDSGNKTVTYYAAREDHTSAAEDRPIAESDKWAEFYAEVWELWADPSPWQSGTEYKTGDLVSFEETDADGNTVTRHYYATEDHTSSSSDTPLKESGKWARFYAPVTDETQYEAGDIVWYAPREQHYVAQADHNPSKSDEPLSTSSKWKEKTIPADTNFAAQSDHTSAKSDLPLSESDKWTEVGVDDYYNQWEERSGIGNLEGLYDYNHDVYGVAGGHPDKTWFSIDENQGFRIYQDERKTGHWDTDGVLSLGYQEESWIQLDPDIGMKMRKDDLINGQWRVSGDIRVGRPLKPTCEPTRWRGQWSKNARYRRGDVVTYTGDTFVCRQEHTSKPVDEPLSRGAIWDKEAHPVEIDPNGDMILRGKLLVPDKDKGGFKNAGINWRGLWQPGKSYDQGDGVFYEETSSSYVAEADHTSVGEDPAPSDYDDWVASSQYPKHSLVSHDYAKGESTVEEVFRATQDVPGSDQTQPQNSSKWTVHNGDEPLDEAILLKDNDPSISLSSVVSADDVRDWKSDRSYRKGDLPEGRPGVRKRGRHRNDRDAE